MTLKRFVWFVVAVIVGGVLGLMYGWVFNPPPVNNASLPSLREDYKADYALMVAEVYQREHNTALSIVRLDRLGYATAIEAMQFGLLSAQKYVFTFSDLQLMGSLYQALQVVPAQQGGLP